MGGSTEKYADRLADELWLIREYDRDHGIEGDAYALVEETAQEGVAIRIEVMSGHESDYFYCTPREARSLAASILRAADAVDTAGA